MSAREVEWKSLMSEYLMGADILKTSVNEREEYLFANPNSAMDLRHRMVKESTKVFCIPQIQNHCEALKLLRMHNYTRMLNQKEGRIVEKEIARLREALKSKRVFIQKNLNETARKKTKSSTKATKCAKYLGKQCKRLELYEGVCEMDTWFSNPVQMIMETKINQQGIPFDVKVSPKLHQMEESLEPVPTLEESITTDETENGEQTSGMNEGKNEIMKRFFEKSLKFVNKEKNQLKTDKVKKLQEIQNNVNLKLISHVWVTWKIYTQQHRSKKTEKEHYKGKIEAFLSKLQERGTGIQNGDVRSKHEVETNHTLEGIAKARKNQVTNDEKDRCLKTLMEEVKTSQMEAQQRLKEICEANLRITGKPPNLKFLMRIQKRREERLRRWREIQERKLRLEEEKQIAEKLKEDERRKKEEENRRKKLEESKEKRRLETEKRKEQEAEREKRRLAESHRMKYLLRSYGLRPWTTLVKIRHLQQQQALVFFERRLTRKAFNGLVSNVREETARKVSCATEFHERMLKRNFLLLWRDFHSENVKQNQVATDWNELRITERAFKKWLRYTQNEQLDYLNKKQIALLNYERALKSKCLKKMRDYPESKRLEQAQEYRKRKWRERVKEILPDYQPAETSRDCWTVQ